MKLFEVLDAAVTAFRAMDGYGTPSESGVIPVYDGPGDVGTDPEVWLCVGTRAPWATDDSDTYAASMDNEWLSIPLEMGNLSETVTIACGCGAFTGYSDDATPDYSGMRADVESVLSDITTRLRNRDAIGLDEVTNLVATNGTLRQEFSTDGARVWIEFDLTVTLRS